MDYRPVAVTYEENPLTTCVVIRTNIEEHKTEPPEGGDPVVYFTCDMTRLDLGRGELTDELRAAIEAAPERFVNYIPASRRPSVQKRYTDYVQKWMDKEASTHGYDNIQSACTYENSSISKFKAEGLACREWRDNVWTACYAYLDDVIAGKAEVVPVEELVKRLPQMQWPEVEE